MTFPNWQEIDQIQYLDQLLAYCILVTDATNRDEYNLWWKNSAARQEARDSITWQIVKDDSGEYNLVYTTILDYYNATPLLSKNSLSQSILTITPHQMADNNVTIPNTGKGMPVPPIPEGIETLEHLLWWSFKCSEVCLLYVNYINLCNNNYWVPQLLPMVNFGINPFIIMPTEIVQPLPTDTGTQETSINDAFDKLANDNQSPVPGWLGDAIRIPANDDTAIGGNESYQDVDIGKPLKDNEPIYHDPNNGECKEQDPSVIAYNEQGYTILFEVIEDKKDAKK